jgi:hypothetical protein
MAGLVPAIHAFALRKKGVDARLRGHDGNLGRRFFFHPMKERSARLFSACREVA